MTHVLIVEDEERISSFVRRGLASAGYVVSCATSGYEALEILRGGSVDLVLLDIGLRTSTGRR